MTEIAFGQVLMDYIREASRERSETFGTEAEQVVAVIDVTSAVEFKGQNDECVLYTLAIGANDTWPRALTIDGKGNAYVGTYADRKAYKLDLTQTPPTVTKVFDLPSSPYGFVVRGDYLYASALGEPVMRTDLLTDITTTMNAPGNYGITVDQNGIAWFGGSGLQRCDFELGGDCVMKGNEGFSGVAVDAEGQIWGATGGSVSKYDNSGVLLGSVQVNGSYGVAIGHDGKPRVISNSAAHEIEPGAKGAPPVGVKNYYTGTIDNPNIDNYTYTDFTGFGALNVTIKKGEWTVIHDGGDVNTQWSQLVYNTEKEAKIQGRPGGDPVGRGRRRRARAVPERPLRRDPRPPPHLAGRCRGVAGAQRRVRDQGRRVIV